MKFISFTSELLDRLFIVAGAFFGSQIPQFTHQYTQRLAGHVESLHKLVAQLNQMASLSHKTLDEYIQKFQGSSDLDFNQQGNFMQGIVNRYEELNQALVDITQSPFWLRPYYFLKKLQPDIAHSTMDSFQPGINLSIEGFCYAAAGMLTAWILYRAISRGILSIFNRLRSGLNRGASS